VASVSAPHEPLAPAPARAGRSRRRRVGAGLAAILLLALLVRLAVVVATPHFRPINDAADYDRYAVSLVTHGRFPDSKLRPGPTALRPPLFALALAGAYEVTGVGSPRERWEAGRVLEALLGTATVALVCLIALRLWGPGIALLAGALAALSPPLVLVGSSLMSESLSIPLGLAGVLAALTARSSGRPLAWSLAAGVLVGLAALARATELLLVVPVALLVWRRGPGAWRAALAVLVATVVTLVPWTVRNFEVMHTFVPISDESGYALIGTYNSYADRRTDYPALYLPPVQEAAKLALLASHGNEAQVSGRLQREAFDYAEAHPAYPLKVAWWTTLRLLNLTGAGFERYIEPTWGYSRGLSTASVYYFWVLGMLALAGAATAGARRVPWAFWLCPLALLLATVFVIGATRYRSPADPFIVMLAALGVTAVARTCRFFSGGL
jgi:4-amino-4-deoxy-L-arabinose transferase-like glycosyltransferase